MEKLAQSNVFKLIKKVQSPYLISLLLFSSLVLLISHPMGFYSKMSVSFVSDMKFIFDRNYVFLIFNGILVILVKSSSSFSSSSSSSPSKSSQINNSLYSNNSVVNDHANDQQRSIVLDEKKQEFSAQNSELKSVNTDDKIAQISSVEVNVTHSDQLLVSESEVQALQHQIMVSEYDQIHIHVEVDPDHIHDDKEDDAEDAEELNKRCEDFIRKMKQGIRSESWKDIGLVRYY